MNSMEEYIGVGTKRCAGNTTVITKSTVKASSKQTAKRLIEKRFDKDRKTLHTIYKNWDYKLSGAVTGDKVWSRTDGWTDLDE